MNKDTHRYFYGNPANKLAFSTKFRNNQHNFHTCISRLLQINRKPFQKQQNSAHESNHTISSLIKNEINRSFHSGTITASALQSKLIIPCMCLFMQHCNTKTCNLPLTVTSINLGNTSLYFIKLILLLHLQNEQLKEISTREQ